MTIGPANAHPGIDGKQGGNGIIHDAEARWQRQHAITVAGYIVVVRWGVV